MLHVNAAKAPAINRSEGIPYYSMETLPTVQSKERSRDPKVASLYAKLFAELTAKHSNLTNGDFLQIARSMYGEKKVRAVCERYDLFNPQKTTNKLRIEDVEKIEIGLKDINGKDLDRIMKKIRLSCPLLIIEQAVLNELSQEQRQTLKQYGQSSELPPQLFNELIQAFRAAFPKTKPTQKHSLSLSKISGMPGKYFQHGWLSHQKGRYLEDAERLRIYEEIESLAPTDNVRYFELLAKIIVKKHLYYEKKDRNQLTLGMLIPALKGQDGEIRWYRVSEIMDSGWGKFGYRLVPATKAYAVDMPDCLLYRSSATLPTAMDSFTSYLNDLNVLPPGYLSRHCCKKQERRWFTEPTPNLEGGVRPLVVIGHSLGAAHGQIALMNLQKNGPWPNRKISLELFDSPAIAASDAKDFAMHYTGDQPLHFNYYVSKNDLVPLAGSLCGSSYLGSYFQNKNVKAVVHELELMKKGADNKEISGLGPHGRVFFRGKEGQDFKDTHIAIEVFDKKTKQMRFMINSQRAIASIFVWSVLGPLGVAKRFFFGRRHHDPIIKKIGLATYIPNSPYAKRAK